MEARGHVYGGNILLPNTSCLLCRKSSAPDSRRRLPAKGISRHSLYRMHVLCKSSMSATKNNVPNGVELIFQVSSASSIRNKVADGRQVLLVSSLETTTIVNNEVIVVRRNVSLINTCFAPCGVGGILRGIVNTQDGIDQ